jgi:DNA mismatch repair protein MutL
MPTIRRLPDTLVNRIAAGEVVERPASALKELVENAIDAGATQVHVRLGEGGLSLIEVTDDGCGMRAEEIALALERHATSKLPDESIELVETLGFRGEALPSIASVARVTIESRARETGEAWKRVVDHGALVSDGPAALPPGTRVRVEDLFGKIRRGASSCARRGPNGRLRSMSCAGWPWHARKWASRWSTTAAARCRCSRAICSRRASRSWLRASWPATR